MTSWLGLETRTTTPFRAGQTLEAGHAGPEPGCHWAGLADSGPDRWGELANERCENKPRRCATAPSAVLFRQ